MNKHIILFLIINNKQHFIKNKILNNLFKLFYLFNINIYTIYMISTNLLNTNFLKLIFNIMNS